MAIGEFCARKQNNEPKCVPLGPCLGWFGNPLSFDCLTIYLPCFSHHLSSTSFDRLQMFGNTVGIRVQLSTALLALINGYIHVLSALGSSHSI